MGYNRQLKKMKKYFVMFSIIVCTALFLSACVDDNGSAPKNVTGKTLQISNPSGSGVYLHIAFSSNTSATLYAYGTQCNFSSIKYSKTGANKATVKIKDFNYYADETRDEIFNLEFFAPNEGTIANSFYTFTLN